jgi:hypothetical protein
MKDNVGLEEMVRIILKGWMPEDDEKRCEKHTPKEIEGEPERVWTGRRSEPASCFRGYHLVIADKEFEALADCDLHHRGRFTGP